MSKVNTLFKYFSKKPTPSKETQSEEKRPDCENIEKNGKIDQESIDGCSYGAGDLVWAKLDGYPWWPSMVCNHPTEHVYWHGNNHKQKIHVQFFDDPISRGWVKEKFTKPYKGRDHPDFAVRGGRFYTSDPECRKSAEKADLALALKAEERLDTFLVQLLSSSDESDGEKAEPMEFDDTIFDKEEDGSGKENDEVDLNSNMTKQSPAKSLDNTPKKNGRPKRSTKRRRVIESGSEESEDEFQPKPTHSESSSGESSGADESDISASSASEIESPVKGVKRKRVGSAPKSSKRNGPRIQRTRSSSSEAEDSPKKTPSIENTPTRLLLGFQRNATPKTPSTPSTGTPVTPSVSSKTKFKLASYAAKDEVSSPSIEQDGKKLMHLSLTWLNPDKIRDADKNRAGEENYDPRTLYVPPDFLNKQTPAMRQWWELKAKYFDVVMFFKMGKFYELFHMDAVVAVNELGLIFMKGDYAHSGFPEIAFGRYSETLIQKGYKVARIEQTETTDMVAERCKQMGKTVSKYDRVVRRELCSIQSRGTKRYSFLDGDAASSGHAYLLACCEKTDNESSASTYGVCFVDTSIGKFHLGQFTDDRHCSRLRTLLSHHPPAQLLYERGRLSQRTQQLVGNIDALKEVLMPGKEFWDSKKTLKVLSESDYFVDEKNKDAGAELPDVLKAMLDESDSLGQSALAEWDMAISALGAITWYLKKCLMDHELLSMKNFDEYQPVDSGISPSSSKSSFNQQHMVLDGVTLANLDILENSSDGGQSGTLLERMDMCCTPFGQRLFKQWLCTPLCAPVAINDRLDAVDDLSANPEVMAETIELLKKLPDLERLLSKIHTLGSGVRKDNHPDGRAVMFEEVNYSKRKIEDFVSVLFGFKQAQKIAQKFAKVVNNFKSKLLTQTVAIGDGEDCRFPDLTEQLTFFDNAFDTNKARAEGSIKPRAGMDPEYDDAITSISRSKKALDEFLDRQRKRLGCKTITYWGTGKNRYQMEIPEHVAKNVPDSYEVTSQKKGFKRYRTQAIEDMLKELTDAEDRKDEAVRDCLRRIFFSFDRSYQQWDCAVQCISVLDVLISLARYSHSITGIRPEFELDGTPVLEIREARHPCVDRTVDGSDFIPNDTVIGCADETAAENDLSRVVLVTGPNMGGKSTLMRQVGLIVVMAQMGCYVPAEKCRLTPVDRVFTRLGASDRIMAGESTFFVELSETSAILQHATKHSLVLMDELGRGTATYDGTAIACAVVNELSQAIGCRTLFSTHYHSLVEEFSHDSNVRTGHMSCMVENENDEDPTQETITFLYKFTSGACPKSYGFNAASLANLPDEIIKAARKKAIQFEETVQNLHQFRALCEVQCYSKLQELHSAINVNA